MAEVKAPLLRARLAETDGQDTAHTLLAELEAAQTQLPPDQIALLLPQFAWTRLQLVIANRRTKIYCRASCFVKNSGHFPQIVMRGSIHPVVSV